MPALLSPRLLLLPLTRAVMARRLEGAGFVCPLPTPDGMQDVYFPPEWPGDALPMFPALLADLNAGQGEVDGTFIAVHRGNLTALGQLGVLGGVNGQGEQQIGYGLTPEARGRGYATEAVGALVAHLHAAGVVTVTAQTATSNPASSRVLQKLGFRLVGSGHSDQDGPLSLWAHT
ncbi:GNAT family N-acetyltransferase [Deinococcus knuensis]|uniref:GNAT family N-acetyltransferase n=1 Tax=Deinococcus knuensis TaxID=1837380 RepID=UPI001E51FB16|nr:GNAT family N-acetyltransferase [Deinococcus knuensis]